VPPKALIAASGKDPEVAPPPHSRTHTLNTGKTRTRAGLARREALLVIGLLLLLAAAGWWFFGAAAEPAPAPPAAPPAPNFPFQAQADPMPEGVEPVIVPLAMRVEGDYRFQDHLGQVPFAYEPPIEPWRMLEILAPATEVGWYPSDHPESLRATRREPEATDATLGGFYWHKRNARAPGFLGALRQEMAPALGKSRQAFLKTMPRALSVASWIDAVTTRGLAQMSLRLVPPGDLEKLIEAVDALALALYREGRHEALAHLLEAGPAYLPAAAPGRAVPAWPAEPFDAVFTASAADEADRPRFRLHLALARGDAPAARAAQAAQEDLAEAAPAAPGLIARLEKGLGAGLSAEDRTALGAHFKALARHFEGHGAPIPERFADWPTARVLEWVRWTNEALHGMSDPGADALLYLLEHRRFEGADLLPDLVIQAAFRVTPRGQMDRGKAARYEYGRAAALFALVPALAWPPYPPGRPEVVDDGMRQFNGFEAPLYAWYQYRSMSTREVDEAALQEVEKGLLAMVEYSIAHCQSEEAAGIAGRPGYLATALEAKWDLLALVYGKQRKIEALEAMIARPPSLGYRRFARHELGNTLEAAGRDEEAMALWRLMARGHEGPVLIANGIWNMGSAANKADVPLAQREVWLQEALRLARAADRAYETGHFTFESEKDEQRARKQLDRALRNLDTHIARLEAAREKRRPREEPTS